MDMNTTTTIHMKPVLDSNGDTVDYISFCSDYCHREWCDMTGQPYEGWNGCHEVHYTHHCMNCDEVMSVQDLDNFVWHD